ELRSTLKHIIISTRADNHAQKLYKQALGAEVEAKISKLYSDDEVFMVARNV
ncbi:MAG: N-acetyltransferase, partial [Nitrospirota bacterium]|nr:N-acetyltransferase [Nitrospirota bacterium]